MNHDDEWQDDLDELDEWDDEEEEEQHLKPRALVLETHGFQFLFDTRDLWKPARVLVRRGFAQADVWLDEYGVEFMTPGRFSERDEERILSLVREHFDDLLTWWVSLRDDVRRGRLGRNVLVD